MKIEINPEQTSRARAYKLWITAPMPMVNIIKRLELTNAVKVSKKKKIKLNAIMCYCLIKAGSQVPELYYLPENGKFYKYDRIAVDLVVNTCKKDITFCAIPYIADFNAFYTEYLNRTKKAYETCKEVLLDEDCAIIGTSALVNHEIDGVVNIYSERFSNPFLVWGRYQKKLFKKILPISMQFHHVQMDGKHALNFLDLFQKELNQFKI